MIYLTTGGNGAGKTLLTLKDVRDYSLKEGRPVFYRGFEALVPIKEFGWQQFEPEKWQDLPDGSICIFDEAQEVFPSSWRGKPPQWAMDVAKFRRKRGFDFWLITPHPTMLDVSIRRLIETPSWHRHLKRPAAGEMVSQCTYSFANTDCEKPGANANGEVKMRPFPKEVYSWYKSASLHTAKRRIPRQVWYLLGAVALVPFALWAAYASFASTAAGKALNDKPAETIKLPGYTPPTRSAPDGNAPKILTAAEYVLSRMPRIEGFPHTAPAYDQITAPAVAPYPAACVQMGARCECYTQQGTKLTTPQDTCTQITRNGFFVEWSQQPLAAGGSMAMPAVSDQRPPVHAQQDANAVAAMRSGRRAW